MKKLVFAVLAVVLLTIGVIGFADQPDRVPVDLDPANFEFPVDPTVMEDGGLCITLVSAEGKLIGERHVYGVDFENAESWQKIVAARTAMGQIIAAYNSGADPEVSSDMTITLEELAPPPYCEDCSGSGGGGGVCLPGGHDPWRGFMGCIPCWPPISCNACIECDPPECPQSCPGG